jgi:hypothetical protein
MSEDPIDVGSTSNIFPSHFGVVKVANRKTKNQRNQQTILTPLQERAVHALVQDILAHPFYTHIKTPILSLNTSIYEMERIDTSVFRTLAETEDHIQDQVSTLAGEVELKGVVLMDYELFVQPDDSVMILDYNRCILLGDLPSIVNPAAPAPLAVEQYTPHG